MIVITIVLLDGLSWRSH